MFNSDRNPVLPVMCASLLACLLLIGCDFSLLTHDDLTFEQRPYLGDELRMDGFYYDSYLTPEGDGPFYSVHFFYRNGVVRYVGSFERPLDSLTSEDFLDGDSRYDWGLFHVDGDQIAFERWYPPSKTHTIAAIRSGRILNDTTFVITESRRSNGDDVREEDETYHFRAFSPKPDSTSRFLD